MTGGRKPDAMLPQVLAACGLEAAPADWTASWERSQAAFPGQGVFFLTPAFVRESCAWIGLDAAIAEELQAAAGVLARDAAWARFAWHCHWLLFLSGEPQAPGGWPLSPQSAPAAARLVYALVLLSGLPRVREAHRALRVEEAITRDTLADLELWIREYEREHGCWGFREKNWLVHHFTGQLFKLGRLQYLPGIFPPGLRSYRHRADRRLIVLADDGIRFRADGQCASADGGRDAEPSSQWTATLRADGELIRGHVIDPRGHARPEIVTLSRHSWEEVLAPGAAVLTVHIPATGSMKPEECGASFAQAARFHAERFPAFANPVFTCDSWLLDPQLEQALPATGNIVRFLQEWYLHPVENAGDAQTLQRVFGFGVRRLDPATAPQETSLQKAVVAHVRAGGRWRMGGGLFFAEDLPWGRRVYRNQDLATL